MDPKGRDFDRADALGEGKEDPRRRCRKTRRRGASVIARHRAHSQDGLHHYAPFTSSRRRDKQASCDGVLINDGSAPSGRVNYSVILLSSRGVPAAGCFTVI